MYVDSHCHLHFVEGISPEELVQNAVNNKVEHMLCVATTLDQHQDIMCFCNNFDIISGSVGVHPDETVAAEPSVADLLERAASPKIVAIGETGLDYFRTEDPEAIATQQQRFRKHIQAAKQCNKPLIVHTRSAREDTIKILREEGAEECRGVLHCFTESLEMAQQAIELNFLISFSGIVTFKNALELQEVAKVLPLDKILIETDSPYLAPVPLRGKTNQPANVIHVAEFIAKLRGISVEEVAEQTTKNFHSWVDLP
ncbi:MAG: DNAase [Thiotrichales bacterium]|nr:MAG: DNAase [Thiotrichales bacterium]